MKKIAFIFWIFQMSLFGQKVDSSIKKKTDDVKGNFLEFSDSMTTYYKNNAKYLVFAVNFFEFSDSSKDYCITFSYILNSGEINSLSSNYYGTINGKYLMAIIDETKNKKFISGFGLKKLNSTEFKKIKSLLYPSEEGGFTYVAKALISCEKYNLIDNTFYSNADVIPYEKSIHKAITFEGSIKKIK